MKVTRDEPANRQVVLSVELDPPDLEQHLHHIYRRLVNRVQIPGFRKGKAPRSVLETYLGRDAMIREGLDTIVLESLNQAISQEQLEPFGDPEIEELETDPVSFKAVVPLQPNVDLGSFRELRLEPEPANVTDEQVDEFLQQLRRSHGVWEPREDRVRFGDLVTLDVNGTIEGQRIIHERSAEFIPQQENPVPLPGFSIYLEGLSPSESKDFILNVPEDHPEPAIAGKECSFTVKVLGVKELRLPDLDDEFAKEAWEGYETMDALRAEIRHRLQEEAERHARRELEERTLEEVLKGVNVEFSPLTESRELERMMEERARTLRDQRLPQDIYMREITRSEEEVREQLRPEAIKNLTRALVLSKLGEEERIEVTDEEVEAEIDRLASLAGGSDEGMRRAFSTDNARSGIRSALLSRKVMERLGDIVQGTSAGVATAVADPEPGNPSEETQPGGTSNDDESP